MTDHLHETEQSVGGRDVPGYAPERTSVRRQLEARRDFGSHLFAYVVGNAALVFIWAMTGQGYFWPAWVMGAWGIGLVMHAWDVFMRRPVTEADVDAALQRQHDRHPVR